MRRLPNTAMQQARSFARCCASVVVSGALVGALLLSGCAAEAGAAARYQDGSSPCELPESAVTAYIEAYRAQVAGAEDAEVWNSHLEDLGLSAEGLRERTVRQLVTDHLVEERARAAGVVVEDGAVGEAVDAMKDEMAFGDDEIFADTLALGGMTEESLRALTAQQLLQEALLEAVVPQPDPSTEDLATYVAAAVSGGQPVKHIFYVHRPYLAGEPDYEGLEAAQALQAALAAAPDEETFAQIATDAGDVLDVAEDVGWSVGAFDFGAQFQAAVEGAAVGEVSSVFADETGYGFVWISEGWQPVDAAMNADALLDAPASLLASAAEGAAADLWPAACQEYLNDLYEDASVEIEPMPSGLSYDSEN